MKKLLTAACSLLLISTAWAKDYKDIKIAVDVPYEPFEFQTPDGELTGFEIELGNAVCADLKLNCEWVIQAWDGIIAGLMTRKYDVIFSSMSITEERAKTVLFSKPYYTTPSAWFAPSNSAIDTSDPASFKGKTVGVQRGTIQDTYVSDLYGKLVEVKRYTAADDMILDLKGGRLDAIFVDYPVGESTVAKEATYKQLGALVSTPEAIFGQGIGAAFRPRDKELKALFDESLDRLKANGTYDRIMNKYFSYSIKI